jgi:hypothetical protein
MNHNHQTSPAPKYTLSDFYPLIIIFSIIFSLTAVQQFFAGFVLYDALRVFMGIFFLVFGSFKVIKFADFAQAYAEYDIIAKRLFVYGYAYPFLELGLGFAYLINMFPVTTNLFTLVLMCVSAVGVAQKLLKREQIMCACLGTVFKIPMTYVTLAEDLIMAFMAMIMLVS